MDRETTTLLQQAKAGSGDAMNLLFEHIAERLLAFIRLRMGSRLRSRMESRDILQASMLKAFEHLEQLKGEKSESLMAWLARIAENEIRDQADFQGRRRRDIDRSVPIENEEDRALKAQVRSQVSQVIFSDQMRKLEKAIEDLDLDYREIIMLRKLEELSYREIGERLGKSADACRMLLARAMTAVAIKMKESA
ncbi:MAG: RNA polymerase sigma factor [Acidobacteriota bacterium]|jgi:RNA polymerase sigma-70 factor (ECF subfamily)